MPVKRRELIRRLRLLGFGGPFPGGRHEAMRRGELTVRLPNPHGSQDISDGLLGRILRDTGITREEWERAGEQ